MAVIVPTITATDAHDYRGQMLLAESLRPKRIHVDFMDGVLSPTRSPSLDQAWWPENLHVDLHIMYERPVKHLEQILKLKPQLVIIHAESSGNFTDFAKVLHKYGIKVGVALLPKTPVKDIAPAIEQIDHVLIFSGNLGHFGGTANPDLLTKAQECRDLKKDLEIGWDGGVNDTNIHLLAAGGIDVLNVGGFVHKAHDPVAAYAILKKLIKQ